MSQAPPSSTEATSVPSGEKDSAGPKLRGTSGQDFMGSKGMFERCGFRTEGKARGGRTVMRYRFKRRARR